MNATSVMSVMASSVASQPSGTEVWARTFGGIKEACRITERHFKPLGVGIVGRGYAGFAGSTALHAKRHDDDGLLRRGGIGNDHWKFLKNADRRFRGDRLMLPFPVARPDAGSRGDMIDSPSIPSILRYPFALLPPRKTIEPCTFIPCAFIWLVPGCAKTAGAAKLAAQRAMVKRRRAVGRRMIISEKGLGSRTSLVLVLLLLRRHWRDILDI